MKLAPCDICETDGLDADDGEENGEWAWVREDGTTDGKLRQCILCARKAHHPYPKPTVNDLWNAAVWATPEGGPGEPEMDDARLDAYRDRLMEYDQDGRYTEGQREDAWNTATRDVAERVLRAEWARRIKAVAP